MAALVNLFKMFDKLDDIVYEPVKMVCDLCRQPIRNAEAANERKKMETEEIDIAIDLIIENYGKDLKKEEFFKVICDVLILIPLQY